MRTLVIVIQMLFSILTKQFIMTATAMKTVLMMMMMMMIMMMMMMMMLMMMMMMMIVMPIVRENTYHIVIANLNLTFVLASEADVSFGHVI